MKKRVHRRRGLSGRKRTHISRSRLRSMAEFAQRQADQFGERWCVIRIRNAHGWEYYSAQPLGFKSRLLDHAGSYVALTIEPKDGTR